MLQIRLNLNSHAVNLARSVNDLSPDVPLNNTMAQAEQYCYHLAINSLAQLRVLSMIDERILQYAQDSMSIMVACEYLSFLPKWALISQTLHASFAE